MTIEVVVRTIWRVMCAASSGREPGTPEDVESDLDRAQRVL